MAVDMGSLCEAFDNGVAAFNAFAAPIAQNIDGLKHWLSVGISPSVLATVNSIVVALMVLAVGVPSSGNDPVFYLPKNGRRCTAPQDIPRVALFEAVIVAGAGCLVSTLILTLNRPDLLTDPDGEGRAANLVVLASNATMLATMIACMVFAFRWTVLVRSAPRKGASSAGSGFLPST